MHQDSQNQPEERELAIQPGSGLTRLHNSESPALSEIVNRSLAHISKLKGIATHRIGDHQLCDPDYQLVCFWADELNGTPEQVLNHLLWSPEGSLATEVERGRFKSLFVYRPSLCVSGFPGISGLTIERLCFANPDDILAHRNNIIFRQELNKGGGYDDAIAHLASLRLELDLSTIPNLKELYCGINHIESLELSNSRKLNILDCSRNSLTHLDLSDSENLVSLNCCLNKLTYLDMSGARNLEELICGGNRLVNLDLSSVPDLRRLDFEVDESLMEIDFDADDSCHDETFELDIRPLRNLECLRYDSYSTRLIQRPDQNFK